MCKWLKHKMKKVKSNWISMIFMKLGKHLLADKNGEVTPKQTSENCKWIRIQMYAQCVKASIVFRSICMTWYLNDVCDCCNTPLPSLLKTPLLTILCRQIYWYHTWTCVKVCTEFLIRLQMMILIRSNIISYVSRAVCSACAILCSSLCICLRATCSRTCVTYVYMCRWVFTNMQINQNIFS